MGINCFFNSFFISCKVRLIISQSASFRRAFCPRLRYKVIGIVSASHLLCFLILLYGLCLWMQHGLSFGFQRAEIKHYEVHHTTEASL